MCNRPAKTFVAVEQYFDDAAVQYQRQQQLADRRNQLRQQERTEQQELERQAHERQQFETRWLPVWEQLPVGEQEAIRSSVLATYPFLRHTPHEMQFRCLQEMARQSADQGDAALQIGERGLRTARNQQL